MTPRVPDSFTMAVQAEAPTIRRQLNLLGVHEADVGNALEETLRMVFEQRLRFTHRISARAFCFGMAARVVAGRERRHVLRAALTATPMMPGGARPAHVSGDPESIGAALGRLPFKQRVALVAVELQGMTPKELAYALGIDSAELLLNDARVAFAKALRA